MKTYLDIYVVKNHQTHNEYGENCEVYHFQPHFCPAPMKLALDLHVNFCVSVCLFVCLSVCVSGLFFKASNWMIYWLLTVVLATYLSD